MSATETLQITSNSPEETEQIGASLGYALKGGEVIELISDLGGGKTTFMRGIARGSGSTDKVASPTFTISKVYKSPKLELHHFDFYRLNDAGLMAHELHDILGDPKIVLAIEWGNMVKHVLPKERVVVEFAKMSDEARQLQFTYPTELSYLVKDLC